MENSTNNAQNTSQKRKQDEPSTSAAAKTMRTAGKFNPSPMPQEMNPVATGEPSLSSSVTSTNPGQQKVSNNSSLHGTAYHLRLGMVIMLRLFKMYQQDNQHRFELAFEDPEGGKFDDITLRYSSPRHTSGTIRIQAKHKDTTEDVQQTSSARDTVSEEDLLPEKEKDQKKGPFSLRMYFESARRVMESCPNEKQTFILCTNKSLHPSVTVFEKVDIKLKINIDFLDDLNATCYQLNCNKRWKELDDVLKPASEDDVKAIYDNFVLVCNSHNADQLTLKALELLHDLVNNQFTSIYNALHTLAFAAMDKGATHKFTPDVVKAVLKKHTGTPDTNKYSNMTMNAQMLRESKLYGFLENKDLAYTFPGYYSKEFSIHLIAQTVSVYTEDVNKNDLNPTYEMIFIDCASFNDCEDVTDRLRDDLSANFNGNMHNVYRLGHILNVIFTHNKTVHHSKFSSLEAKENEKKQQKYRFKILFIETIENGISSDGRNLLRKYQAESTWRVANLSEHVRKQANQRNTNLSLFGTTVSLETLIENDDPLRYLIDLDAMNVEGCDISHKRNYEKIESWYVGRRFKRFVENDRESESETDNNFDDEFKLPGFIDDDSGSKVNVILNDAGHGKSTVFTKLAYRLSIIMESSYVIRLNAIDFSTDFKKMKSLDIKGLDTAKVLKMFYYFIYLVLFWHNGEKDTKIEKRREEAKACADLLTYSDGSISGDKVEVKQMHLTTNQLAALRVFREKYNAKQLIVLLDGFDEIAPTYKEIVLTCFQRFSQLEGVRIMYISSRPYHFIKELEATFPGCRMYELQMLSKSDQEHTVRMYVRHKMEDCDNDTEELVVNALLKDLYNRPYEIISVPLLLFMTLQICFPIVEHNVITEENAASNPLPALDILQLFEAIVKRKVQRRVLDKQNKSLATLDNVDADYQFSKTLQETEDHHALLAMLVIFSEEYQKKLLTKDERNKAKTYIEEAKSALDKTGIIIGVQDDTPQFIIRTFTEYFAALWLYNNWERMAEKDFFQCGLFWSEGWSQIRDFFDRMGLRGIEGCDLHLAIMNRSEEQVRNLLSDSSVTATDKFGRLPLHLAVSVKWSFDEDLMERLITEKTINATDELCQWGTLNYAFATRIAIKYYNKDVLRMLKNKGAEVHLATLVKQICFRGLVHVLSCAEEVPRELRFFSQFNSDKQHFEFRKQVVEFLLKGFEHNINPQHPIPSDSMALDKRNDVLHPLAPHLVRKNDLSEIEDVLYFTVKYNLMESFRIIFQHLCRRYNISTIGDSQIDVNIVLEDVPNIQGTYIIFPVIPWDRHPVNNCCSVNVKSFELPEKKRFILKSFCYAITTSECNIPLIVYIIQTTNIIITKEIIMLIVMLLSFPNYFERYTSHSKYLPVFKYLLDRADIEELNREDEEGCNLLHWTAQHGCIYMLHCLIEKGLDPTTINAKNGWNVFHYALDAYVPKSYPVLNKISEDVLDCKLAYLLFREGFNMFGLFESILNSIIHGDLQAFSNDSTTNVSIQNSNKLNKEQLALMGIVAVFGEICKTELLTGDERDQVKPLLRQTDETVSSKGIIKEVSDEIPIFFLDIFGEYYAACWLYENYHRLRSNTFFHSKLYWKEDFSRMMYIFDLIVLNHSNGCKLHLAIIQMSEEQAIKLLSDDSSLSRDKDKLGRLPLHLAVRNGLVQTVEKLLNIMSLESINMRDELLGWNALDYAFVEYNVQLVKMLLSKGVDVHIEVLANKMCSCRLYEMFHNTKQYASLLESYEETKAFAKELYIRVVQHLLQVRKIDVNARHVMLYNPNETVKQHCQRLEYNEILEQLELQATVQPQL